MDSADAGLIQLEGSSAGLLTPSLCDPVTTLECHFCSHATRWAHPSCRPGRGFSAGPPERLAPRPCSSLAVSQRPSTGNVLKLVLANLAAQVRFD